MTQIAHLKQTRRLTLDTKQAIALDAIANNAITHVANTHNVARNTVYAQKTVAINAIDEAFNDKSDDVIFNLPVTKSSVSQMIV